jgi:hypothetical protein
MMTSSRGTWDTGPRIDRVSLRDAKRLAVEVILDAVGDLAATDEKKVADAIDFIASPSFDDWCAMLEIDPAYLRRGIREKSLSTDENQNRLDIHSRN